MDSGNLLDDMRANPNVRGRPVDGESEVCADKSRLVYHSKAFDEDDVDMTYVGSLIR